MLRNSYVIGVLVVQEIGNNIFPNVNNKAIFGLQVEAQDNTSSPKFNYNNN